MTFLELKVEAGNWQAFLLGMLAGAVMKNTTMNVSDPNAETGEFQMVTSDDHSFIVKVEVRPVPQSG